MTDSPYGVVRIADGYQLDRVAPPCPGAVARIKRISDRSDNTTGWKLVPLVTVQGSASRIWPSAAAAIASTRLMTEAQARRAVTLADIVFTMADTGAVP